MRDELMWFTQKGAQPLGVNPAGVRSHARYADTLRLGFPLLSDPDRAIAAAYGALKEDGVGVRRTVYAIGRDGRIAYAVRGAPPPAEILAALD